MIRFIVILFVLISFPTLASEICPDGVYKYDSELDKTVCSTPFDPDAPPKCPGYVLHEGKTVCKTSIVETPKITEEVVEEVVEKTETVKRYTWEELENEWKILDELELLLKKSSEAKPIEPDEEDVVEEDVCIITHETDEAIYWTGKIKSGICAKPCNPCEKMEYSEELKEKVKKEGEPDDETTPPVEIVKPKVNFDAIIRESIEPEIIEEHSILKELETLLEESEVIIVREVPIKLPIPVEEDEDIPTVEIVKPRVNFDAIISEPVELETAQETSKEEILEDLETLLEEPEIIIVEEVPIKLPVPVEKSTVESTVECLPSGDCYDPNWQPTYEGKKEVVKLDVDKACTVTKEDERTIWYKSENAVGYCTKPCTPCEEIKVNDIKEEGIEIVLEDIVQEDMKTTLIEMGWAEEEDIKVENFDLEQQLLRVIRNHPRVLAALKDVEVSKEAIKITNSSRKPQASITTNNGIEEVENPGSDDVNRYYDDQTLTITQLLSDFGRSKAATDKAISDKMITDLSYKQTVQSVVSEGLTAYYGLIKAYNTFKTNSAIMAGLKEQQKQMQAKLEAKKATIDQFNAIKSQVVAQQSLLISLQYAYDMAQNRFSAVFSNLPADISSMKMAKIDSSITIPDTEKMAVYWSSKGSISIGISKQTLESSELQAKVDKKQWAPTITLKMDGITTSTGGTDGIKVDKSLYVTMSVPLYTGGMNSAMKRQSMEAVEASLLRLDDTRTTVRESVQNAFAGYKVAEANIKVLLIQYQMAKEALDNAQKQVEAGKMPIDSLTPLKNNLLNMQTSLKNASADLELAKMSLFLALGWLEITQDGEPAQNSIKITTDSK